jgi:hypothetical protein
MFENDENTNLFESQRLKKNYLEFIHNIKILQFDEELDYYKILIEEDKCIDNILSEHNNIINPPDPINLPEGILIKKKILKVKKLKYFFLGKVKKIEIV